MTSIARPTSADSSTTNASNNKPIITPKAVDVASGGVEGVQSQLKQRNNNTRAAGRTSSGSQQSQYDDGKSTGANKADVDATTVDTPAPTAPGHDEGHDEDNDAQRRSSSRNSLPGSMRMAWVDKDKAK